MVDTATVDLRPATVNLLVARGDAVVISCPFDIDLTGYTGWEALARSTAPRKTYTFTVDSSQQGSRLIVISLAGADCEQFAEAAWSFKAIDPAGNPQTFLAGTITTEQVPTSGD